MLERRFVKHESEMLQTRRDFRMESAVKNRIWNLQYILSQVQSALIDSGIRDIEKHIRRYGEVLRYYSLLMDLPEMTTVTGAQGVGKSYHVNQMCEIPEEQRLLSSLGRAEKIPVFLMARIKGKSYDVRLYKRTAPSGGGAFVFEDMSYQEARERVERPKSDDLCMFWQADGNAVLDSLSPISVLPGFEHEKPWEMAIKIVLDLSDTVIYVTDQSRSAMDVSVDLEAVIRRLDLQTPPVVLLSKADNMPEEQIKNFSTRFNYNSVPVGVVEPSSQEGSSRVIGTQKQYDKLLEFLGEHAANAPSSRRLSVLEDAVDNAMMYLEDARDEVDKNETKKAVGIDKAITAFISKQEDTWENLIRTRILDHTETTCVKAATQACKSLQPRIENEFTGSLGNKIKLWWNGGVTLGTVNELQNELSSEFSQGIQSIESEILRLLQEKSENMRQKLISGRNKNLSDLVKTGRELILVDAVITPIKGVNKIAQDDLITILEKGKDVIQAATGTFDEAVKATTTVQPIIEAISLEKGRKRIFEEIQKLPDKKKAEALKDLVTGGLGAGGAAMSGAEIAGAGFSGLSMSVVAGVVGGAVAAMAVGGWLMSITRTANRTAFDVDDLVNRCANAMSGQVQDDISTKLDRFWKGYKHEMRNILLANTGLASGEINTISLAKTTHSAIEECKELVKALALANAE